LELSKGLKINKIKTSMGWAEMGSHVLSLSFLSFGPSREEGWIDFFISFPCYGWGQQWEGMVILFLKINRSLVGGGGKGEIHWKVTCVINFEIS
jgi:hypothetical protein